MAAWIITSQLSCWEMLRNINMLLVRKTQRVSWIQGFILNQGFISNYTDSHGLWKSRHRKGKIKKMLTCFTGFLYISLNLPAVLVFSLYVQCCLDLVNPPPWGWNIIHSQTFPNRWHPVYHQRVFSPVPLGEKQGIQVLSPSGNGSAFNGLNLATAMMLSWINYWLFHSSFQVLFPQGVKNEELNKTIPCLVRPDILGF